MAAAACNNEQKVPVTLTPKTASGRPAQIQEGSLQVVVNSGTGTVEMGPGPLDFFLVSGDLPGATQYAVSADADLGEGVVPLTDIIDLEVSGAQAESLGLSIGTPVPK